MPQSNIREIRFILDLLQQHSTLDLVRSFFKGRGLPHSATAWAELENQRILPALESGKITAQDLLGLTREREEYGRQHIFLYQTNKAKRLSDATRVKGFLRARGIARIVEEPLLIDKPSHPTIVEARWEENAFVLKIVKTRYIERHERQSEHGDSYTMKINRIPTRAVHVIRLNSTGLLEMRIESHATSGFFGRARLAPRYDADVTEAWEITAEILPHEDFEEESLAHAKSSLWKNRKLLKDVQYSGVKVRNQKGNVVVFSTGEMDANLSTDSEFSSAIDTVYSKESSCERSNLRFLHEDGAALPSRDIHVLIGGRVNEFAIPGLCSKDDYEYALGRLLQHNK